MIILITGSSASGKTTIGRLLAEKCNYDHIDGDQVIKDLGLTSKSWNSIHGEIIRRSALGGSPTNAVISHVVLPDKFEFYEKAFRKNNVDYRIVVLDPKKSVLLDRNQIRTCHPRPTPLDVIDYFHGKFRDSDLENLNCYVLDNSGQAELDTVDAIVDYCGI